MKRSNRLVLLVGVFLALIAFVGILLLARGNTASNQPVPPPTTGPVVVAAADIPLSTRIAADQVTTITVDLTAISLADDEALSEFSGHVEDSGEGRWTIQAAIEQAVPAEVLSAALYTRFRSRQDHTFAERILSAMRKQFGGHQEPKS